VAPQYGTDRLFWHLSDASSLLEQLLAELQQDIDHQVDVMGFRAPVDDCGSKCQPLVLRASAPAYPFAWE